MNANAPHLSDAAAHNTDHTIDRALAALRDAAPHPGLESRILTALDHRAATPQPARPHLSAHLALWTATAAAVLAIASLLILHHHATPTELAQTPQASLGLAAGFSPLNTAAKTNGALAPAQPPTNPVIQSEAPGAPPSASEGRQGGVAMSMSPAALSSRPKLSSRHPERGASARSRRTAVFENCSNYRRSGCPIHDGNVVMGGVSQTSTDAQLLADLHAPSHPAPPLPLTPQEKLFLRMLQYGNATQLAELNPVVRDRQDADEATAFKAFFPDPPPLEQPNGDTE
jgi:hypothetical protein